MSYTPVSIGFRADDGFAVCDRDQLVIAPPRIEPSAGLDERHDEYQFGVRLAGDRYGVALFSEALPADGIRLGLKVFRLDDVGSIRQILKIRERSSAPESAFFYLCGFARGLLICISASDERSDGSFFSLTSNRQRLVDGGVPVIEIPGGDARIELARLAGPIRGAGELA